MGKKEKDIAKLNAEYYKEVNEAWDCFEENEEDILQYENNITLEMETSKFDNVLYDVTKELLNYVSLESLPLCEKLDSINLESYINFILCGCPIKKTHKKINVTPVQHEVANDCFEVVTTEEMRLIEEDIKNIKNNVVQTLGEEYLLNAYNTELRSNTKKGKVVIEIGLLNFRKSCIKKVGANLYWKTVDSTGTTEYNRLYT